mgnify:CR=1 FL=1
MNQVSADTLSLIVGIIMTISSCAIVIPQFLYILRTKNTSGTSLSTYIVYTVAGILWLTWALMYYFVHMCQPSAQVNHTWLHQAGMIPAIISNFVSLAITCCILFLKIKHICLAKQNKMNELELSKLLANKEKNLYSQKTNFYIWWKKYLFAIIIFILILSIVVITITLLMIFHKPQEINDNDFKNLTYGVFVINIIAAILYEGTSWPQFIKNIKYRDTSGISLGWAIFFPITCIISFSYDLSLVFASGDYMSVLASLICNGIIVNTCVLIFKIINQHKAKKSGITEIEYTKKFIQK